MSTLHVDGLFGLVRDTPDMLSLLRLAAITVVFGLVARIVYNLFLHPLRVVPGPWSFAATGFPRYRMYASGDAHKILRDLHIQYGNIVRVGPNEVSFAAAHAWNDVFGQKRMPSGTSTDNGHGGHAYLDNPKEQLFYGSITRAGSLLNMPQADHTVARKSVNGAFSAKAVADQEPLVQRHADQLIAILQSDAQKKGTAAGNVVDIAAYSNWAFFDIIGDLAFGEPFGSLVDGTEHAWVAMIPKAVKGTVLVANLQRLLGKSVARIAVWLSMTHEQRNRIVWHRTLTSEKVDRRAALGPGRPDFMTNMLENTSFWNLDRLHGSLATFITAGSETSATTMSAAILFLTTTPTVSSKPGGPLSPLEKLTAEVRGAFASDADIKFASVRNLPYLGAVIDEALRMHPPAVWGFNRQARAGGITVAGGKVYLPEDTVLTVCHYAMFRNPRNFALADKFVPERWLGEDERFANDQHDAFQPFSYGPRNCIGRYLANAEMRTILARIVYNFDLAIQPESRNWAADQKAYAFWSKGPLMVAVSERADKA
ncbi:hypothetical protein SCUCBS95973_000980 [Sporothrix curviconia]|uniref:Cytochrome P450 monooxygenase n=1 Tax=Sporothrix curviconia TaxID=1260050 RepID=A0ABP0AV38_9PEZI